MPDPAAWVTVFQLRNQRLTLENGVTLYINQGHGPKIIGSKAEQGLNSLRVFQGHVPDQSSQITVSPARENSATAAAHRQYVEFEFKS